MPLLMVLVLLGGFITSSAFATVGTLGDVSISVVGEGSQEQVELRDKVRSLNEVELDLLVRLYQRSTDLDKREKVIRDRENVFASSKVYIQERMKELKELQSGLESVLEEYKREENIRFSSLVKIYENMKPQDAASILENLEMSTLLEVVARMKEVKIAPIMAKMNVAKAREVTEKFLRDGERLMSYNNVCSCELLKPPTKVG